MYKTYKTWNEEGYFIKKGSKAHKYTRDRVALFSENQVEKKQQFNGYSDPNDPLDGTPGMFMGEVDFLGHILGDA
jgi:hypothetical protein